MDAKITQDGVFWNDKPVDNPILRCLVAVLAAIGATFALIMAMALLIGIPILVAVTFPLHCLLQALGRRGFIENKEDGTVAYIVNLNGFRHA